MDRNTLVMSMKGIRKTEKIMSTSYDGTTIGSPVSEREVMLGVIP